MVNTFIDKDLIDELVKLAEEAAKKSYFTPMGSFPKPEDTRAYMVTFRSTQHAKLAMALASKSGAILTMIQALIGENEYLRSVVSGGYRP